MSRDYQVSWPYKSRPHFTKTARQRAASDGRVIVSHDPFLSRKAALSGIIPTADSFWTLALVAPSVGRMVSGSALALECAGTRPRGPGTKKMRLKAGETSPYRTRGAPEASNGSSSRMNHFSAAKREGGYPHPKKWKIFSSPSGCPTGLVRLRAK